MARVDPLEVESIMKILIVEDEALVAMAMKDYLASAGHIIVGQADDFDTAVTLAAETQPDLALVDVNLVDGDSGIEVASKLTKQRVPCLMVTSNCNPMHALDGAVGCLQKPVSPSALLQAVAAARQKAHGLPVGPVPRGLALY